MAQNESLVIGDVVKWEEGQMFSRETLTVKDGESLVLGEAFALDTGKVVALTGDATGAVGVILEAAAPSGADGEAVCLVRNAVVDSANVTLAAGNATELEAALKDVDETTGYGRIIVRTGPTYTTL